jgi:hypothetical protein
MHLHSKTAAPRARDGGGVDVKAVTARFYLTTTFNATDLAAAILGARFGLSEHMARVICELSGIGGRA